MLPKIDSLRIWAKSTDADIIILSETWLSKLVTDKDIVVSGYNVYRTDRPRKAGGVAIYVKSKFIANVVLSISVSKQLEFLALNVEVYEGMTVTVVGSYRPPSAVADTLQMLSQLLSQLQYSEIVLAGDMNWDWFKPASDGLKGLCNDLNLTQLIESPTRPNPKKSREIYSN